MDAITSKNVFVLNFWEKCPVDASISPERYQNRLFDLSKKVCSHHISPAKKKHRFFKVDRRMLQITSNLLICEQNQNRRGDCGTRIL